MRSFVLAAGLVGLFAGAAFADPDVAGQWRADMGDNVVINMNVSPAGNWSSETLQRNSAVRQMRGTYKQTPSNDHAGVLVFTPTEAHTRSGKVTAETDNYEISNGGSQLKLTSGGDTMVFEKQDK